MTKDELIAKQQMKIENLEARLKNFEEARDKIMLRIVCISGPLNDNVLKYSREQRVIFHKILREINYL